MEAGDKLHASAREIQGGGRELAGECAGDAAPRAGELGARG